MPCAAMAWWRSFSVNRSLRHQAPPWHSTSAGNGPSPFGLNTRASSGLSPWRRYSTSSTSNSCVLVSGSLASKVAVVMASLPFTGIELRRSSPTAPPTATRPGECPSGTGGALLPNPRLLIYARWHRNDGQRGDARWRATPSRFDRAQGGEFDCYLCDASDRRQGAGHRARRRRPWRRQGHSRPRRRVRLARLHRRRARSVLALRSRPAPARGQARGASARSRGSRR